MPARKSDIEYIIDSDTGCWEWQLAKTTAGYAETWNGTRPVYAHRTLYEDQYGPIPPGMQLDHLCRNRGCVNPDHMEPVTNAENSRRGDRTKLTWEQVHEIRSSETSGKELAAKFGVAPCTISHVRTGRSWVAA